MIGQSVSNLLTGSAIYTRVSIEDQVREGYALQVQQEFW
jgi:hypothetical protein